MSGRTDKDIIGANLLILGSTVIDRDKNIDAKVISGKTLRVTGCFVSPIKVGENVTEGDVLVPSASVDRTAILSTGNEDIKVLGVACNDALSGETVDMAIGGEFQVKVTGNVARGDFLETSSTNGVAIVDTNDYASFAIAMETNAEPGIRLVKARFIKSEIY